MTLIDVDTNDGVAVVTLNDGERRNVLSLPMVDEIVAAFDRIEADDSIGAVVVTGAGSAFCAGADLGDLGRGGESGDGGNVTTVYDGFLRVARSTLPTVAAVNGPAVGAGMNLALACDVRLVGRSGRFDTRFLRLGLHPGGGHTWMLQRAVGPQAAAAMVLFGQVLEGEVAAQHGLAWRCVDDDALLAEAIALAASAAGAPRELAIRAKQTLQAVAGLEEHGDAVAVELEAQRWSFGQPFFAERLAAMRERVGKQK
ncbi:MAG TPA: enoyl-CoA hydratase [Acidimicrobiales bacterium]|nr:enoyl-CoA hydratase [Acidimicrobiales bacterium]